MLVDRHPEREPDLVVAQVPGESGAGAGAVASHQDRLLADRGKLGEGEVGQLDQVSSAAGGGVAWPQQTRERLTRGLAAVQVGQQRVEPEGVLVGARRAFLMVAVGEHQGRVGVDDQQLDIWTAADSPRAGTGMRPGGTQPGQPVCLGGDSFEHPPGGRGRGDLAEQLGLLPQGGQVAQAVATIGQHHRQIPQHRRVQVAASAFSLAPAKRPGQSQPVG